MKSEWKTLFPQERKCEGYVKNFKKLRQHKAEKEAGKINEIFIVLKCQNISLFNLN